MSTTTVDAAWLERLADGAGAKVEIDAEGSVVVSPATDRHVLAANRLARQLAAQVPDAFEVLVEGPRWAPLGAGQPSYVPDVCVVAAAALDRPDHDWSLDPAPLLVIEVLSPDTRRRDLGEKSAAYYAGGALAYWTLALPGLMPVSEPTLDVRRRGPQAWMPSEQVTGTGTLGGPLPAAVDLGRLVIRPSG